MFKQIRYQTGESAEVASEMKKGIIPCMDVNDMEEFNIFKNKLLKYGIRFAEDIPYDKSARNTITEPEFEFRAAFYIEDSKEISFLDVYFEPEIDRTYDSVGEM